MTNPDDLVVNMFPHRGDTPGNLGLTKREYFAIQCLQGLLSNPEVRNARRGQSTFDEADIDAAMNVVTAVGYADLLIAKLNEI